MIFLCFPQRVDPLIADFEIFVVFLDYIGNLSSFDDLAVICDIDLNLLLFNFDFFAYDSIGSA